MDDQLHAQGLFNFLSALDPSLVEKAAKILDSIDEEKIKSFLSAVHVNERGLPEIEVTLKVVLK